MLLLKALVLGIIEGVTEFLPVSSTGHLILASAWIDFPQAQRNTFEIFIQLGAILAVIWHFRAHLFGLLQRAPSDRTARDLLLKVLLAFLPAAAVGFLVHHAIEEHLFSPRVVAMSLIIGGVAILAIERRNWGSQLRDVEATSWSQALIVGVAQLLSLIPGMSRSACTIIPGMMGGMGRPAAAQFSFYLSIPTLAAASLYSLWKARSELAGGDILTLGVGFVASFVAALIVVRGFIHFVQRHDFSVFGVYRIVLGTLVLLLVR